MRWDYNIDEDMHYVENASHPEALAAAKQWCESELDAVDWGVMPNGLGNSVKALCRTWGIY